MRHFVVLALFAAFAGQSFAAGADKSSGCGVGWYVTEKYSLSATTTRGTTHYIMPPTFSMTSGTSGCAQHSLVLEQRRSEHFVEANYDHLREDAAAGRGPFIAAFVATLHCTKTDHAVPALLQQNYGAVFGDDQLTPAAIVQRAKSLLRLGAATSCSAA